MRAIEVMTRRKGNSSGPARPFGFQRILVAVDASPASRYVGEWARALATVFHARVTVIGVVNPLATYGFYGEFSPLPQLAERAYRQDKQAATEAVEKTANQLRRAGIRVEHRVVDGPVVAELLRAAKQERSHLLVMGSNNRRAVGRALFGSVVDGVKNRVPASIFIARGPFNGHRVLVGTDGSVQSRRAAGVALRLSRAWKGYAVVLHAVHFPDTALLHPDRRVLDDLGTELARVEQENRDPGVGYRVVGGQPADALLAEANARDCGLIVVGSRGLGAVRQFMLGSVSNRLTHLASQSLLLVKDGAAG